MPRNDREAIAACVAPKLELAQEERERDAKLAERAFLSLCVLTGHSFGTHYEETRGGFSWGSLSDSRWQLARNQLNAWAFETFGAESVGRLAAAAADWSDAELEVEIR